MHAWRLLHALPRAGFSGRQYAGPFDARLPEIVRADGHSVGESAIEKAGAKERPGSSATPGADPARAGNQGPQACGNEQRCFGDRVLANSRLPFLPYTALRLMANILYGVNGEGAGHSTRAKEVFTHLIRPRAAQLGASTSSTRPVRNAAAISFRA